MKNKYTEDLLKLIKDNPDLPIVPMVDGEIAPEEDGYWRGQWGPAAVDEYLVAERHERIFFKSEEDMWAVLEQYLPNEEYDSLPDNEDECSKIYENLLWKKAIVVYINSL